MGENGVDEPFSYFRKMLSKAERYYSIANKEFLADLLAVKYYRPFLYGTTSTVVTDHASLKWLQNMKDLIKRLARWALNLQHYDMNIEHRDGARHINVDCLTQLPILYLDNCEAERLHALLMTPDAWDDYDEPIKKMLAWHSRNTKMESESYTKDMVELVALSSAF